MASFKNPNVGTGKRIEIPNQMDQKEFQKISSKWETNA
jgi:hypothetical protein